MGSVTIQLPDTKQVTITSEDSSNYVIKFLRKPPAKPISTNYASYGYEIYLRNLLAEYLIEAHKINRDEAYRSQTLIDQISPPFMDACWDLCRRGILRPYTTNISGQGSNSPGFSVTSFGDQWLNESDKNDYVPTEPGRFSEMLAPFAKHFGNGFQARAQEAVRCYNAHAYLACCVMCGAAAETIINSIADVLVVDRSKNANITKIRADIISKSPKGIQEPLIAYSDIVKYWRDSGMHHEDVNVESNEAYVSLAMLLRLGMFAQEKWFFN